MDGSIALYNAIKANTGVTDLLTTFGTNPAICLDIVEPITWGVDASCISIYSANPVDKGLSYLDAKWTVNCRAETAKLASELSSAVLEAINRQPVGTTTSGGRFYCVRLFLIRPLNQEDAYNMPIEVTIKGSKNLD